jgi:phosphate butyryltransferase
MVCKKGFADPILIGDKAKITEAARKIGMEVGQIEIMDEPSNTGCINKSLELVRNNNADVIMKGKVTTGEIMKAVMDKEKGLRTSGIISHIGIYQVEKYHKLMFVTDPAINIAPDLNTKIQIIQNAVDTAVKLGIARPKVAVLSAVEKVSPSMQSTMDAAILSKMMQRGQITGCIVDGPFAMDNAISAELAAGKGITSEVAGDADIFMAPNIDAANILIKTLVFMFGAKACNVVAGTRAPIILTSRSDDSETKYYSILAAIILGLQKGSSNK